MNAVIGLFEVDVAFVQRRLCGPQVVRQRTETLGETELRVVDIVYFVNEVVEDVKECLFK